MSDNLARVMRPHWRATAPAAEPTRHIEIVSSRTQRRARPRVVYALAAVGGIAVIILAQLLLSVGISQGAYDIARLQSQQVELGRTADGISEDLVRVSSPQSLAANAEALGMVSNSNPVYLRLSDGAVLGAPSSASGDQGAAAGLVPNALLAGAPLITDLPAGGQGTGVAGPADAAPTVTSPVAPAPPVDVQGGLPSPTTR